MSDFYEHLFGVRGKVALVTGGTRGIGLMIAEGLVRAGARVYVSSRKVDACMAAERALGEHGHCVAIPGDIGNIDGCEAVAAAFREHETKLDILVNNAGLDLESADRSVHREGLGPGSGPRRQEPVLPHPEVAA